MGTIHERHGSGRSKKDGVRSTYQTRWRLKNYTSAAAYTAMIAATPPSVIIDGVTLNSILPSLIPKGKDGDYYGIVDYKHTSQTPQQQTPAATNDELLSFNFTGPSTFFTRAISQTKHGPDATDFGVALNVLEDKSIAGIDAALPDSGFEVRAKLNLGATPALVNAWIDGRIAQLHTANDATFRGKTAEDCVLAGFSGEQLTDGDFDVAFDFRAQLKEDYTAANSFSAGRETFTIGKIVPGFHLIWVQYLSVEDTTAKVIYPKANGVYVAKVFETSDFSQFGITT